MTTPGPSTPDANRTPPRRVGSDAPFIVTLATLGVLYVVLIVTMLAADLAFTSPSHFTQALASPDIRYSIILSVFTCNLSALLSVLVAVPTGYLMTRYSFRGKALLDAVLDIPVVLPPLVVGLSLLLLFRTPIGQAIESAMNALIGRRFTYAVPGVVLAQFMVACAFAVRTMRATFDQIPTRQESVALTLGATRAQAFRMVVLPQAWRGVLAAGTIAWARSLGEFGPILVFAGATRQRTEVLSTTVFLELSVGNIEAAVAVSLIMVALAVLALVAVRLLGKGERAPGVYGP